MAFTAFRGMHPFAQFLFSLFVMAVSFTVFMIVAIIVGIPFFGIETLMNSRSASALDTAEGLALMKYFQVVQSIAVFVTPPFVLAWLYHGNISEYLKINRSTSIRNYFYAALAILLLIPLINFTGEINSQMKLPEAFSGIEDWIRSWEDAAKVATDKFLKVSSISGLLFNLFMIAILPALGEELLFRGVIQRIFTGWTKNYHWGIWIAAFIFSALHFQFYSFLPRMLLGAMFGYLLVWTGTLWVPILAHFVNNTMGVIGYYLIDKGTISRDIEDLGTGNEQLWMVLFSLVTSGLLLFLIYREQSNKTKMPANHLDSQAPRID